MKKESSWGRVAEWYDEVLKDEDSYQHKVILPNLLRLMTVKPPDTILDIACGQGFFSFHFAEAGAKIHACDISSELIKIAQQKQDARKGSTIKFEVAASDKLHYPDKKFDKAVIVLALQNIEKLQETIHECARVLKKGGALFLVINHPTFRIPKQSSWSFDEKMNVQYRRIDSYMSDSSEKILMHPGEASSKKNHDYTYSFHRPLQSYFKALSKADFTVKRLEEWISHKKSEKGKRSEAEDRARKEFPLFLFLEAIL